MDALSEAETPDPAICLEASATEENGVEVAVHDNGPGVPPDHVERIFEPFFTTREEGMGMGLAICRSIVDHHGGRLWAMANPGGGTTMRLALPGEGTG